MKIRTRKKKKKKRLCAGDVLWEELRPAYRHRQHIYNSPAWIISKDPLHSRARYDRPNYNNIQTLSVVSFLHKYVHLLLHLCRIHPFAIDFLTVPPKIWFEIKNFGANFKLNEIDEILIHSILGRYIIYSWLYKIAQRERMMVGCTYT